MMLSKKDYMIKAFAVMEIVDGVIMFLIALIYGATYFINVANNADNNLSTMDKVLIILFITTFFVAAIVTFFAGRFVRKEIEKKDYSFMSKCMLVAAGALSFICLVIFFLMGFLSTALVYLFFIINSFILLSRIAKKAE